MKGFLPVFALCLASAPVTLASAQAPTSPDADGSYLDVTAGYRTGKLQWNIASDIAGTATPNILSELTWEDLDIYQVTLATTLRPLGDWYVYASATYGSMEDGENQDSDYVGDNRSGEFSRSNNSVNGDEVWDMSAAVGYTLHLHDAASGEWAHITPMIGYSRHEQNMRITDGFQTIPPIGSFAGLNATYQAEWDGPWVGVDLVAEGPRKTEVLARLEYHRVDYYGEGNWNLRDDLAHPKSFEHTADGDGLYGQLGIRYPFRKQGYLLATVDGHAWETDAGTDRTFPDVGAAVETRLNEASWESWSVNLGISYAF